MGFAGAQLQLCKTAEASVCIEVMMDALHRLTPFFTLATKDN